MKRKWMSGILIMIMILLQPLTAFATGSVPTEYRVGGVGKMRTGTTYAGTVRIVATVEDSFNMFPEEGIVIFVNLPQYAEAEVTIQEASGFTAAGSTNLGTGRRFRHEFSSTTGDTSEDIVFYIDIDHLTLDSSFQESSVWAELEYNKFFEPINRLETVETTVRTQDPEPEPEPEQKEEPEEPEMEPETIDEVEEDVEEPADMEEAPEAWLYETMFTLGQSEYTAQDQIKIMDTEPFLHRDRLMIPVRYLEDIFGVPPQWNEEEQEVSLTINGDIYSMRIGEETLYRNGQLIMDMGVDVVLRDNRTFVPASRFARALNVEYQWDEATGAAVFSTMR